MLKNDLSSWLQHLEALPSGLRNNSLDSVKNIAQKLGLLNFFGKIIIVGGTNGKGSTVVFLESILLAAGYKTGAYISPHLLRYNERIRLNGKEIDDEHLCQVFAQIDAVSADSTLSYFEFSTLAALSIFKQQAVDVLILEVGLGGRFDAVNILDADIAIITTISLDHTNVLGETTEAIGCEKAGIIRPFKPVICGDYNIPASVVIAAKQIKAKLYSANQDFAYTKQNDSWSWWYDKNIIKNLPLPHLPIANASVSLMAINLLQKDFKISNENIISGLENAFLFGRGHRMNIDNKQIIFDVAHNPEAAALLAQNLVKDQSQGRVLAVMSMLDDKNITATLQKLTKVIDRWYISALEGVRAASVDRLKNCLLQAGGGNFVLAPSISEALQQAIAEYQINDRILIFGSFRVVADGLKQFNFL